MKKKEVEVFKVMPEYKKISKKRKKDILIILLSWVSEELNKLK